MPRPIHIDPDDPRKHTQTVEATNCRVKMRLRLGRGLHRHNLQTAMDFEDFVYNRTNGTPAEIFKKLGDAAKEYVSCSDLYLNRLSNIPYKLPEDDVKSIQDLTIENIKLLCKSSVFQKLRDFRNDNP